MGFVKEFKDFAMRGNLVDLAVAVVMGGAFGKVVSAFVDGIVMPAVGKLILNIDFSKYKFVLQEEVKEGDKVVTPEVAMQFGQMITQIIDFFIVAFAVFLVIKGINTIKKKEAEAPAAPPAPSNQEKLLEEIRDLLKKKQ